MKTIYILLLICSLVKGGDSLETNTSVSRFKVCETIEELNQELSETYFTGPAYSLHIYSINFETKEVKKIPYINKKVVLERSKK